MNARMKDADYPRSLEAIEPVKRQPEAVDTEAVDTEAPDPEIDIPPRFLTATDWPDVVRKAGYQLPHWTLEGAVYHVRFRLHDSIPSKVRDRLLQERKQLLDMLGTKPLTISDRGRLLYVYSRRVEQELDNGYGSCYLARKPVAKVMEGALEFFEGSRYILYAWCIMPNHVHTVVQPLNGFEMARIVHSWKSYVAHKANEVIGREGRFWNRDWFDRIIRSDEELRAAIKYVYANPDKAGFHGWEWRYQRQPEAVDT